MRDEIDVYNHNNKEIFSFRVELTSELEIYAQYLNNSVVLLINCIENISIEEQSKISDFIVKNGCRYSVCFGYNCGNLHDSIDWAHLSINNFELNENNIMMTTWHQNESLNEVVFYFLNNAILNNWTPEKFVVLSMSKNKEMNDKVKEIIMENKYNHNEDF